MLATRRCVDPHFQVLFGIVANLLHATHASGSSAGALVAGFLAAGKHPYDMIDLIMTLDVRALIKCNNNRA